MTKGSTQLFNFFSNFLNENEAPEELIEMWGKKKKEFIKLTEKVMPKEKAIKAKKPADAPKAARTGYILLCMEERPKILKEFPVMKNQDIVKLMAKRWAQAKEDEDVMKHFKSLAEDDKKRADKDKENYVPAKKGDEKPKKKGVRTKSGYLFFCDDERPLVKDEGFTGTDIMKELGRRWKALPTEDEDRHTEYMEKAQNLKKKVDSDDESEDEEEKPKAKKKVVKKAKKVVKKVVESDSEDSDDE
jgi:hypothetical protein